MVASVGQLLTLTQNHLGQHTDWEVQLGYKYRCINTISYIFKEIEYISIAI